MCSEFMSKTSSRAVEEALQTSIQNLTDSPAWDNRVRLTNSTPILYQPLDEIHLQNAIFPAQPFPNSRLSSLLPDGQISRIYEKRTWAEGFEKYRCLVPMTSFLEPVYWGDDAGSWAEFQLASANKSPTSAHPLPILFAAAIRIKPFNPPTGKINGFSLLTHTASPQMLKFHHRLLVFLEAPAAREWLAGGHVNAREKFESLIESRYIPEFEVRSPRKLAKGWEKRTDTHLESLKEETDYINALALEGVPG